MDVFDRAMLAAEERRYGDALTDFIWLHDHPDDASLSYKVMRCGYVLTAWITIGQSYPPALAALREVLSTKRQRTNNGDLNPGLATDIAAIESRLHSISAIYSQHVDDRS